MFWWPWKATQEVWHHGCHNRYHICWRSWWSSLRVMTSLFDITVLSEPNCKDCFTPTCLISSEALIRCTSIQSKRLIRHSKSHFSPLTTMASLLEIWIAQVPAWLYGFKSLCLRSRTIYNSLKHDVSMYCNQYWSWKAIISLGALKLSSKTNHYLSRTWKISNKFILILYKW